MSPRRGGEADKFGNRYEGRWTIRHLLYVLMGRVSSITLERADEVGKAVEFVIERGATTEVHQVKRQRGNENEWNLAALKATKVLETARLHVEAGRHFHFVSTVPSRILDELSDRARRSDSSQAFQSTMLTSSDLESGFQYLCDPANYGSPPKAWRILQGIHVRCQDEQDIVDVNAGFAGLLLEGAAPTLAAVGLGDLVLDNLNVMLTTDRIEELLKSYGLRRARLSDDPTVAQAVAAATDDWRGSVARELLQPVITRTEADEAWSNIEDAGRVLFVVGDAGHGKSAIVHEILTKAEDAGWPVLALRLDRLRPFATPLDLGNQLHLTVSPTSALAAISGDDPCLLLIDQLDAVSLVSGRMPHSFDAIESAIRESSGFPNMRVVLACRRFDVDNDDRIRRMLKALGVSQIEVGPLADEQVDAAVSTMGLSPIELTTSQRTLLRIPLNLVLLRAIADEGDALSFDRDRDLLDSFWRRKRRDCLRRREGTRFNDAIRRLVNAMSERQTLTAPESVLDADDLAEDAQVLASEHVLVLHRGSYAFFHESFFDYAFARLWEQRHQTLAQFLLAGEQELFRRTEVRQVLSRLREDGPSRFLEECESLLVNSRIRFHIKDVVLALLRALPEPTHDEWTMVQRVLAANPDYVDRIWLALRVLPWFDRLNAEGEVVRLLRGPSSDQDRALFLCLGGVKERPDEIAGIIGRFAGRHPNYPHWLRWVTRFADLHASRTLLNLTIDALRRGELSEREHDFWLSAHGLADHEPTWAIELIAAYLADQPGAFDLDEDGRVSVLQGRDRGAQELTKKSAERAPLAFCSILLSYILKVAQLTEYEPSELPIKDRHFNHDRMGPGLDELDEVLEDAARSALIKLCAESPDEAQPFLDLLANDPHETAQWLLYEAMASRGDLYAEQAAAVLLEGPHRLFGTISSSILEAASGLLAAIGPHLTDDALRRLEDSILELRVRWEGRPRGWTAFNLLGGLPTDRLSDRGRRRLGELRRAFKADQPSRRSMFQAGTIVSPISAEAARLMKDRHWLRAIAKYNEDTTDWSTFKGGAHQLAGVLQAETERVPDRFAQFALQLGPAAHHAYAEAILMGLGNSSNGGTPPLAYAAIRHVASLREDPGRWLGWPLRKHFDDDIPDDIIKLLVHHARTSRSPTPEEEYWRREGGDSRGIGERIETNGINTSRGECASILGDVIVHDPDGHRTALVTPSLNSLASDPSVAVRSCVAHLIAASLRHARPAALEALSLLVQTDDRLLATRHVANLLIYAGNTHPEILDTQVRRMLSSEFDDVRRVGGQLAAYAALELNLDHLLVTARTADWPAARIGVAKTCAHRLAHTARPDLAGHTLQALADDPHEEVRGAVAEMAGALRGEALWPLRDVIATVINSESFGPAVDQLLITLERATDRIDELALQCARRFVEVFGADVGNFASGASGNADEVCRLVLRSYGQSRTAAERSTALDLIDQLLRLSAYRADELVTAAERG